MSVSQTKSIIMLPTLGKVPRKVIRFIDLTMLLINVVPLLNPPTDIGPVLALGSLEKYLDAARRQQRRIKRAKTTFLKYIKSGKKPPRDNVFNDVHFYLICWARIAKLGWFIRDKTRFRNVGRILRHYHSELQKCIDCRDHLEHFEERLPGGRNRNKLLVPNDLLNMMNDQVTYGGRKLNIGPASMNLLQTIVTELREAILFDAVETLAVSNPDRLVDMIQQAASNIQIARIIKAKQKGWLC